jgi:hypothetical protein
MIDACVQKSSSRVPCRDRSDREQLDETARSGSCREQRLRGSLARISHRFSQKRPEAAGFLDFPNFGEKTVFRKPARPRYRIRLFGLLKPKPPTGCEKCGLAAR